MVFKHVVVDKPIQIDTEINLGFALTEINKHNMIGLCMEPHLSGSWRGPHAIQFEAVKCSNVQIDIYGIEFDIAKRTIFVVRTRSVKE